MICMWFWNQIKIKLTYNVSIHYTFCNYEIIHTFSCMFLPWLNTAFCSHLLYLCSWGTVNLGHGFASEQKLWCYVNAKSHQHLDSDIFVSCLSSGVRFILHGRIKSPELKFKTVEFETAYIPNVTVNLRKMNYKIIPDLFQKYVTYITVLFEFSVLILWMKHRSRFRKCRNI